MVSAGGSGEFQFLKRGRRMRIEIFFFDLDLDATLIRFVGCGRFQQDWLHLPFNRTSGTYVVTDLNRIEDLVGAREDGRFRGRELSS